MPLEKLRISPISRINHHPHANPMTANKSTAKATAKATKQSASKSTTKATAKSTADKPADKPADQSANKPAVETHAFQTEVQQLLHLIIHSLYSNKEIFLRELISNASDACDKLRFLALTDKGLLDDGTGLGIWIEVDEQKKTLSVRDNGIGMNHAEVIENIGTIARSGTRKFMQQMSAKSAGENAGKDADKNANKDAPGNSFIGQFGVGFYSAFLVANEVTVLTRRAGAPESAGVKWVSNGDGEYTVEPIERSAHGTEVILQLQSDQQEYLEDYRLRTIISKYSNHISLPIQMPKASEKDDSSKDNTIAVPPAEQAPDWETVNKGSAFWAMPKNKISAKDHHAFYTALTYDPEPPAVTLHNRVEGKMEYISLFYIPAKAPFDLWDREQRHGIKLYVRRVFIAEDAKQLMPNYLRFVRGLVDSADLPLNVSREFLQQNKEIDTMRAASVKKVLAELKKIASKDHEKYATLWKEYGRVIKEGMIEDFANRDAIVALLRFASTHVNDGINDDKQNVSLTDYCKRMPSKQKAIYYLTADSHASAKSSPHLEVFRKNDIEVLLLSDPVDEWVVGHLTTHEEKPLQSIAKGDLDIAELSGEAAAKDTDKENKDSADAQYEHLKPLVEKIKAVLDEQVKDVRISRRLVDSPACLVADSHDMGGNMERIMQAIGQDAPNAKPILEINPQHAIVKQIDATGELAADWARVLFDHAVLAEGAALKDPGDYVKRINKLLAR